jgi:hypothetical protein
MSENEKIMVVHKLLQDILINGNKLEQRTRKILKIKRRKNGI